MIHTDRNQVNIYVLVDKKTNKFVTVIKQLSIGFFDSLLLLIDTISESGQKLPPSEVNILQAFIIPLEPFERVEHLHTNVDPNLIIMFWWIVKLKEFHTSNFEVHDLFFKRIV